MTEDRDAESGAGTTGLRRASDRTALAGSGMLPLLGAVARDALDPSYAAAAHRRRRGDAQQPLPPVRRRHLLAGPLALAACGLLAGIAVAGQRAQAPAAARARIGLVTDARARGQEAADLARQVNALQADIQARQAAALRGSGTDPGLAQQTAGLLAATAQTAVTGPGAVVVLADAPAASRPGQAGSRPPGTGGAGRVLDREVQDAVNALWSGGAEAVSVGQERLSPLSAIRTAGQTILVDYRPLSSPYEIRAVGAPELLARRFEASAAASRLRAAAAADGISVQTQTAAHLDLPAAAVPALREAHP